MTAGQVDLYPLVSHADPAERRFLGSSSSGLQVRCCTEPCSLSCMPAGTDEAAKLKAKKKRGRTAGGNTSKVCLLFSITGSSCGVSLVFGGKVAWSPCIFQPEQKGGYLVMISFRGLNHIQRA